MFKFWTKEIIQIIFGNKINSLEILRWHKTYPIQK